MGGPPKRTSRHPRIQPSPINLVLYLGLGSCALRLTVASRQHGLAPDAPLCLDSLSQGLQAA